MLFTCLLIYLCVFLIYFLHTILNGLFVLQIGENNWNNMSERERQRRLMELKLKERQLRRDGKYDELATLLGTWLDHSTRSIDTISVTFRIMFRE